MRRRERTQLHFVGIGGIGMSGIAEVFLNQGHPVSGSDLAESETTRRLASLGARISIGHRTENVLGAHVVVVSSAVKPDNPEVVEARRLRVPVIPRAEMLGELMRGKTGIAVAGSHGKTTTTSMLATILTQAGLDPTLVIGGKVDSLGGNAKLGRGELVVAEADESDGSFLYLPATFGIITNIDNDHLDHFGSIAAIEDAFVKFVGKLPFYGMAAVCAEDEGVRRCLPRLTKPVVTYGFSEEWDYSIRGLELKELGSTFEVVRRKGAGGAGGEAVPVGRIELGVPGRHNALNALGAIVLALRLGLDFPDVARGIAQFKGVKRRFEIRWREPGKKQAILDDYGHHPTEILATLAAARTFWKGRIVTVFQPHRFSRTLHCKAAFETAFGDTDVLYMTDIYAAGEEPIEGISSSNLARSIQGHARPGQTIEYSGDLEKTRSTVLGDFRPGDLVICLGAGSITRLPDQLIQSL